MAVRKKFSKARILLGSRVLGRAPPDDCSRWFEHIDDDEIMALLGSMGAWEKGAQVTPITGRSHHPSGEAPASQEAGTKKKEKVNRQFTPATPQSFPAVRSLSQETCTPPPLPPCFKTIWLPRALSKAPVGEEEGKTRGKGCRVAFPGASQACEASLRGPFRAPSPQAISGEADRPWISGTGPGW